MSLHKCDLCGVTGGHTGLCEYYTITRESNTALRKEIAKYRRALDILIAGGPLEDALRVAEYRSNH